MLKQSATLFGSKIFGGILRRDLALWLKNNYPSMKEGTNEIDNNDFNVDGILTENGLVANITFDESEILGEDVITNGGFEGITQAESTTGSDWITGAGWTISGGTANCNNTSGSIKDLETTNRLLNLGGKNVRITFTVSNYSGSASMSVTLEGTGGTDFTGINADGTYSKVVTLGATENSVDLFFQAENGWVGSIDNVSIKEVTQVAPDKSNNSNGATLYTGKALSFDGVDDYVDFGSDVNNNRTVWTTAIWISNFTASSSLSVIYGRDNTRIIGLNKNGNVFFRVDTGTYYEFDCDVFNTSFTVAKRLVFTSDGTDIKLYLDGVYIDKVTPANTQLILRRLMAGYSTSAHLVDATVSDFQLYDVDWTQADVTFDYNNPQHLATDNSASSIALSNLKGYWHLSEGDGAINYDSSGEGNDGTISSATWSLKQPTIPQLGLMDWSKGSNLITYSEDFSQWISSSNVTITDNVAISPEGSQNAGLINFTSGSNYFQNNGSLIVSGGTYTISCYVKRALSTNQNFTLYGNNNKTSGILTATSEWQRFTHTFTADSTNFASGILTSTACQIYLYGFQVEAGSSPSVYRKTNGTGVTDATLIANPNDPTKDILVNSLRLREGSFNLDGIGHAEIADNASINPSSAITVQCWVYWDDTVTDKGLVGKWISGSEDYMLYKSQTDKFEFYIGSTFKRSDSFSPGWNHLAGVYDGSEIKVYVNGVESNKSNTVSLVGAIPNTTQTLEIGRYRSLSTKAYKERIDDVLINNVALSDSEIASNYNLRAVELRGYLAAAKWVPSESGSSIVNFNDGNANLEIDASASDVSIRQENVFESHKRYRLSITAKGSAAFDMQVSDSNGASIGSGNAQTISLTTEYQTFTLDVVNPVEEDLLLLRKSGQGSSETITVSSVSLIEVIEGVKDFSGKNNHATVYSGNALSFDGSNDYIAIDDFKMDGSTMTMAFWADIKNAGGYIFNKASGSGSQLIIRHTDGTKMRIFDGVQYHDFMTAAGEGFKRYVVVYNSSELKLYVNGVQIGSTVNNPAELDVSSTSSTKIGSNYIANAEFFYGFMSDIQIYNASWTDEDVTFDYENRHLLTLDNLASNLKRQNLIAYLPLCEGDGDRVYNGAGGLGFENVSNGDFSESVNDWLVPSYSSATSASISLEDGALKLEKTSNGDWRSSFARQEIDYNIGSTYRVDFSLKNGNVSNPSVYARHNFDSSSTNFASTIGLTSEWVDYSYTFEATSNSLDVSFGNVNWHNTGVGEYFFIDNVSVKEVKPFKSSQSKDGSVNGATWSTGNPIIPQVALKDYSRKVVFDNSGTAYSQYAEASSGAASIETQDFSISSWFSLNEATAANAFPNIISKGSSYRIYIDGADSDKAIKASISDGSTTVILDSGVGIPAGEMHHVLVTFDRNGNAIMYLNGSNVGSVNISSLNNIDISNNSTVKLGDSVFEGIIDDACVWNRVLTSDEVKGLYNNGLSLHPRHQGSSEINIMNYWSNEGAGAWTNLEWTDLSDNTADMTVVGSPITITLPETSPGRDMLGTQINRQNNKALNFDGESYAEVFNDDSMNLGMGDFTLECWVQYQYVNTGSGLNVIMSSGNTDPLSDSGYTLAANNSGKFYIRMSDGTNSSVNYIGSNLVAGNWYHLVVTREGTSIKGYLDGALDLNTTSSLLNLDSDFNLKIGGDHSNAREYKGMIDEVRIYTRAIELKHVVKNRKAGLKNHLNVSPDTIYLLDESGNRLLSAEGEYITL